MISKFWMSWFLITSTVLILVSAAQIYSREETLDSVREVDFRLVYAAVKRAGGKEIENFKLIADELSTEDKKYILFPMAILSKKSCVNNGPENAYNSLCQFFSNLGNWTERMNGPLVNLPKAQFVSIDNKNFLYRAISADMILVGEAGAHSDANGKFGSMRDFFLKAKNYYFSTKSGLFKVIEKTSWSLGLVTIFSFSAALSVNMIIRYKARRHTQELAKVRKEKSEAVKIFDSLAAQNGSLRKEMRDRKNQIRELELAAEREVEDHLEALENLELAKNEIKALKQKSESLEREISMNRDDLDRIEEDESRQIAKGAKALIQQEHAELKKVLKLWSSKTQWKKRVSIEKSVNSDSTRIPFTLSLAFMAFEAHVEEYSDDVKGINEMPQTLEDKINVILRENPSLTFYHSIRKARNDWFHDSKAPEGKVIEQLIIAISDQTARI